MGKTQGKILVTGATGQQGGAVARELLAGGYEVVAMTRRPESEAAQLLKGLGAHVVAGDLDDEASVRVALDGIWGVFALQNTWEAGVEREEEQGKRLARLAKEADVQHYVYASVGSAEENTGIPHFDNKYRVEQTVRELGFPSFVILRPVFFMENFVTPWFRPGIDEGALAIAIEPDTRLQMVAVEDIGKYGKLAFDQHEELNGQAIALAGDELTPVEAAALISDAAGREIGYVHVPIEQVRAHSEDSAAMFEWFDAVGYSVDIDGNAQRFGIEPTRLATWVKTVDWTPETVEAGA